MRCNTHSIFWKLVLPVPVIAGVCLVAAWVFIPRTLIDNVADASRATAIEVANQFRVIRSYYTQYVVAKVVTSEALRPSIEHSESPDAIPLPATFIHDISSALAETGLTVNLYSEYPFPSRVERQLDPFQHAAWDFLVANPDQVYVAREERDGSTYLRVATADTMAAQGCVDCHNSHAASPKTDWQLGDVRGVLEVSQDISAPLAAGKDMSDTILLAIATVAAVLMAVSAFFGLRTIRPLQALGGTMHRLSANDLTTEVMGINRKDEIGAMAVTVQTFKENALKIEQMTESAKKRDEAAAEEKRLAMARIADQFRATVLGVADAVGESASKLHETAKQLTVDAENATGLTKAASTAADSVGMQIQTLAGAAEELSVSIQDISGQVSRSAERTKEATRQANDTSERVSGLVEASEKIEAVVQLISDIAEQTNLLALNATIEAARAGEAGKGFAVVASEVKSLASQTARATDDIREQISALQSATSGAATSIQDIGVAVVEINEISESVASAVDEQGSATNQIATSVQSANDSTGEVAESVGKAANATQSTGARSADVLAASRELGAYSEKLKTEIAAFLDQVAAA